LSLTAGTYNTALGLFSLRSNTTGSFNTATGAGALFNNNGDDNTATGAGALNSNTTGASNTASGQSALFFNTTGANNTATGASALQKNTTGASNTATGESALLFNTTGDNNTASGKDALFSNIGGFGNVANGFQALFSNIQGDGNTANGYLALFNTTGDDNTALGVLAGIRVTTGSGNIHIGNEGANRDTATIKIGSAQTATFIAGIRGVTTGTANAIPVLIDSTGQLGTMSSSRRFKKEIKPMDSASQSILGLKPVTFHYKSDSTDAPQFGLIAEEVAAVNPDLVVGDEKGEIYTVRYDAVNAMLLNEFLKEHQTVQELKSAAVK